MNIFDILGAVGGILFFIKVGIHVLLKYEADKKFRLGAFGQYTNPMFFLPIFDDVQNRFKILKRIGNLFYFVSLLLLVIFLIGNFHNRA